MPSHLPSSSGPPQPRDDPRPAGGEPGTLGVVVLTLDEERDLPGCLRSLVPLAPHRVLVLDGGSTDRTAEIARRWGTELVLRPFDGWVAQRNAALRRIGTEWVLFLDADERLTPALASEIRAAIASGDHDGYRIPRRNWYLGRPLRCWGPDALLRLARVRGAAWTGGPVHEKLRVGGSAGRLREPMLHDAYLDLHEQLRKHLRYAALGARGMRASGRRFRPWRLLGPPLDALKFLLLKGGILQGRRAWIFALSYAVYATEKLLLLAASELPAPGGAFPRPPPDQAPDAPPPWDAGGLLQHPRR